MGAAEREAGRSPARVPATIVLPGTITGTGLELHEGLAHDRWQQVGTTLAAIGRAHQWWLGDWLNYGERTYGREYTEAVELTGYEAATLRNLAWVAGRVEISRRRDNLSFAHHREVAKLPPSEQDRWLAHAEQQGWTRNDLRDELQALTGPSPPPEIAAANPTPGSAEEAMRQFASEPPEAPKANPERRKSQGERWRRWAEQTNERLTKLEISEALLHYGLNRAAMVERLASEHYSREAIDEALRVTERDYPQSAPERPEQLGMDGGTR
jgi:hypothetical protein